MIYNKKEFTGGLALLALFFAVLFFMFQPMFNGQNSMAYLDSLYNSISKGAVYYIPEIKKDTAALGNKDIKLNFEYKSEIEATQSAAIIKKSGVSVVQNGKALEVSGSLPAILNASLEDSDKMYHNNGQAVTQRYDAEPRRVMYNWWTSLKLVDKALKAQGEFQAAKVTSTVLKKAVETTYNYYEIEPLKITDKLGTVVFSLLFYVFYTLWYGFAILFVFEGWGLKLSH